LSALSTIERHGSLRLGRLAEAEQINKSTVTRLVANLEARGVFSCDRWTPTTLAVPTLGSQPKAGV
jgi:DNA-binding IclR family transcriptional regulator